MDLSKLDEELAQKKAQYTGQPVAPAEPPPRTENERVSRELEPVRRVYEPRVQALAQAEAAQQAKAPTADEVLARADTIKQLRARAQELTEDPRTRVRVFDLPEYRAIYTRIAQLEAADPSHPSGPVAVQGGARPTWTTSQAETSAAPRAGAASPVSVLLNDLLATRTRRGCRRAAAHHRLPAADLG